MISFFKWIKITEILLLVVTLTNIKKLDFYRSIFTPMSYSVILTCFLGLLQTFQAKSIGGVFFFLGERTFDINTPGISTFTLNGIEYLRSYSTFSHPNSLAGFLTVFMLIAILYKNRIDRYFFSILMICIISTLITTVSLNILVALLLIYIVYLIKAGKKLILPLLLLISFITPYFRETRFKEVDYRIELSQVAVKMIIEKPLVGVGLNNFIPKLAATSAIFKNVWELQPVHNIYLLVLAEIGLLGFFILLITFSLIPLSYPLLAILFTGLFDHYWITLQQNMLLFSLVYVVSFAKIKEWKMS